MKEFKDNYYDKMSILLKTMSDKTRLKILHLLFENEYCVCDICERLNMSQSAISHQLKVLKDERLVKFHRVKKHIYYSLNDDHIKDIFNLTLTHIMEDDDELL